MEIKVVDEKGKEQVNEPVEMAEAKEEPVITGELLINSIGQMFDLKPSEIGLFSDKIGTLLEYAKSQTEDQSREGLMWAIRELQYKVGTPPLGEKMINYLNKYAYLKLEENKIREEIKKYEH
jgi:hypothetical protein